MKLLTIGKWKLFGQFHKPFTQDSLSWELLFVFRISKRFTVVAKGKGAVTTYFFNVACFSFFFQKIEQRLKLC